MEISRQLLRYWAYIPLFILIVARYGTGVVHAQALSVIRGNVINERSQEQLANVNIVLLSTLIGDVTDSSGAYQIVNLQPGNYTIKASIIGFKSETIKNIRLKPGESRSINFSLKPTFIQLEGVEVEAERMWEKYLTEASVIGVERLRAQEIVNIPGALDDPTRAVQIFSGIAGGGDYSGYLAVRGGSPDQNQVIIDGVVVPNPYRFRLAFGGALSSINPNTAEDMYLHLGGFSAEYGNSLSSILEVESRTGNRERIKTQVSLNFTDVSGTVDGPFPGGIGSYLISVRRTYYDLVVNRLSDNNSVFPFFFEITGRLAFDIGKTNKLSLQFSRNKEGTELINQLSENINLSERAASHLANINWRKLHGENWQFNSTLSFYTDELDYRAFDSDTLSKVPVLEAIDSEIRNISFKERIRYKTGDQSWLTWGFSVARSPSRIEYNSADLSFLYARVETPRDVSFDRNQTFYETFVESSTEVKENLHLRIGARYDYSTLINDGELSPRFSIWYRLNQRTNIQGSWGIFYQYPNPMSIYTRNIPVDLSQNLDQVSAERSIHQMVAIESDLGKDLVARLQIYNNEIDRLLLPIDQNRYLPRNSGVGFSRGFEIILQKKPVEQGRFSGLVSYSHGKAQYRENDSHEYFPFKYDRRHGLTGLLNIRLVGNWKFSVLGQFATGYPFTNVLGVRQVLAGDGKIHWEFIPDTRLASRFPSLKKVDLRLSYQRQFAGKSFAFYLDLINATNERNIQEITWEKKYLPDETQRATKRVIYMLPIIPSFGIRFRM